MSCFILVIIYLIFYTFPSKGLRLCSHTWAHVIGSPSISAFGCLGFSIILQCLPFVRVFSLPIIVLSWKCYRYFSISIRRSLILNRDFLNIIFLTILIWISSLAPILLTAVFITVRFSTMSFVCSIRVSVTSTFSQQIRSSVLN